jgi:hypothetical protein
MKNLFINLHPSGRINEFMECLICNIRVFDNVYVLNEGINHPAIDIKTNGRPTYLSFFNFINSVTGENDINVIANSDIYFVDFDKYPTSTQCFALTRYEPNYFLNRNDSQDSWIFKGKIRIPKYCSFYLGMPGCDNRIAWELQAIGYEVLNPSLTIKTYHVHKNANTHYGEQKVNPPYLKITPTQ